MSKTTEITDRLSRVSHIGRNVHQMTKLLVSLVIDTRLKMLETSEDCGVSQQWLVQQGVVYWADVVRFAKGLKLSPVAVHDEFKQYLADREEFASYLATKAKTVKKAEPKPAKAEAKTPEPVNAKTRRATKTAK